MNALLVTTCVACLISASTLHAQTAAPVDSSRTEFLRFLAERTAAGARADTAAYRKLVAPELVYLGNDGSRRGVEEMIRRIAVNGPDPVRLDRDPDSLRVYRAGAFAMVDYWSVVHEPYGPQDVSSPYRSADVYALRGDRWLLLRHTETHALAVPPPTKLTASALDAYVGRYEWWPGYIDTITRAGDQLFDQGTGDSEATPIMAATPEAFYIVGSPTLLVSVRDKSAHLVGYLIHWPDGQVTRARKLA